jgi:exodeoxyribonuclease VII large subunit
MIRRAATTARIQPREGEPHVYSVTELAKAVNLALEEELPYVLVQGEITGWRPNASGHIYFSIKDENSQISVSLFRARIRREHDALRDGVAVQIEGRLEYWGKGGKLSLIAERVSPVGYGALQARFDALRRKLEAEGLFREDRKRPLPRYPTRVGIVTSPTGAAIRDMIRILSQNAPYARIVVAPAVVQGEGAAESIADGIGLMNEADAADVLIVGRGGGSIEDLWAFNEEVVVRAIVTSRIPVVSAVGHETDFTLADFAADLRAATPTHAAQEVVVSREAALATLEDLSKHAAERLNRELRTHAVHLNGLRSHHALREPLRRVQDASHTIDLYASRLERGLESWVGSRRRTLEQREAQLALHSPSRSLDRARDRLAALAERAHGSVRTRLARSRDALAAKGRLLDAFDYRGVLRRGYALVWSADGTRLVQRGAGLEPPDEVTIQFQDARAVAAIRSVKPAREEEKP